MSDPKANRPSSPLDAAKDHAWVVIPAWNEEATLARVVGEVARSYPRIVVVDDGSTDGTLQVAQAANCRVVRHLLNRGQGAALQTGIEFALLQGARYVVTFDADGQHRAEDIDVLLLPLVRGECDIVLGSRFLGRAVGIPRGRRFLLKLAVLFSRTVHRLPVTDAHNGLRAFSREAAQRLRITLDGMAHASELLAFVRSTGLRFREVPVEIHYTRASLAKGGPGKNPLGILLDYIFGTLTK